MDEMIREQVSWSERIESDVEHIQDDIKSLQKQNEERTARKNRSWSKRFNPLGADPNAAAALPALLAQLRAAE
jgi:plasmid stabilization system protein ParE